MKNRDEIIFNLGQMAQIIESTGWRCGSRSLHNNGTCLLEAMAIVQGKPYDCWPDTYDTPEFLVLQDFLGRPNDSDKPFGIRTETIWGWNDCRGTDYSRPFPECTEDVVNMLHDCIVYVKQQTTIERIERWADEHAAEKEQELAVEALLHETEAPCDPTAEADQSSDIFDPNNWDLGEDHRGSDEDNADRPAVPKEFISV